MLSEDQNNEVIEKIESEQEYNEIDIKLDFNNCKKTKVAR